MLQRRSLTAAIRNIPLSLLSVLIVGCAAALRFYDYDIAWFGFDQIRFMYDARRILAGELDIAGPDAGGLDILGPLYSYMIAPLLLVRDAPDLVGLFGCVCDVAACWFAFDAARRLTGRAGAIAAVTSYAAAPVLVLGTRMIWNPGLLSSVLMFGWWLVVRYAQAPSTWRLVSVAFVAGLLPALHATGILHATGLVVAALTSARPAPRAVAAAVVAGILPLLPTLTRMAESTGMTGLGARLTPPRELPLLIAGLDRIVLAFPLGAAAGHLSGVLSTILLHAQAVLVIIGIAAIFARATRARAVFAGMAVSLAVLFGSTLFYSQPLAWHHFMAAVAPASLLVALAVHQRSHRAVWACAAAILAALHLPFVYTVGRNAKASGLIQIELAGMYLRVPPATVGSFTVREMRHTGEALRRVVPDGATAMMVAHGLRGELWRETGGEYLPASRAPRLPSGTEFVLMGRGARPIGADAKVIDDRVCAFAAPPPTPWRVRAGRQPADWAQLEYNDSDWISVALPRRAPAASYTPAPPLSQWRAPAVAFRGRLHSSTADIRRLYSVSVHTSALFDHGLTSVHVNGAPMAPLKERTIQSSLYRNREWLFDFTPALRLGENVVVFAIEGTAPLFDIDVFEVPCTDEEWYH